MAVRKKPPNDQPDAGLRDVFGFLLRPMEKWRRNPRRALATPRTTLERLTRDVQASTREQFDREPLDALLSRILALLPDSEEEILGRIQERLALDRATLRQDAVGARLLALYEAADAAGPMAPLRFVLGRPEEEAEAVLSVLGKFDEAERSRGEKRIRAFLEAMPDLLERTYQRHLRMVWAMSFLAEGKWPSRPPGTLNALVGQVVPRVQVYPGLVDADAGRLRNAVAHRHIEYLPSKRTIEFFNPPTNWKLTLPRKAFEAKLKSIWRVATVLTSRLRSIANTEMMLRTGMFAQLLLMRDAARAEPAATRALEETSNSTALRSYLVRETPPLGTDLWFFS